jgi:hypothetical protein
VTAHYQSTTACCPRECIPDECSCPDGCECTCLDCDCPYPLDSSDDLGGDDLFWAEPPA